MAVDQCLGQAGIGAAHADAIVLVEAAFVGSGGTGGDARHSGQGVGDVLVRHLADVIGRDHVYHFRRIALRFERRFDRLANSR